MRQATVFFSDSLAGTLTENQDRSTYLFEYDPHYKGPGISVTMPREKDRYEYSSFPPFFDGLLPEGVQLDALLRQEKLDRDDYFGQLLAVGSDLVGAVTVKKDQ